MVNLATARERRLYGPWLARHRWEYINAGLYLFATILLLNAFASQLAGGRNANMGLVVALIGKLAMVELAVPFIYMLGSVLTFMGILLICTQTERGYYSDRLPNHASNALIAGPLLWFVGSIHNACQVYERADGHIQVLQNSITIPFLMGSLLFLVAGIFGRNGLYELMHHADYKSMSMERVWLCVSGSLCFLFGGLMNLVKVFRVQQMEAVRLEKLRGGAHERLIRLRESQVPLILEENRRKKQADARPGEAVHAP